MIHRQNDETYKDHFLYLDFLRIFATLAVIVLHIAAQNWYSVSVTSYEWHIFNIIDSAVRWSVPIFVMISGALFLDRAKEISIKKLYCHNILKMVTAFAFWSAIFTTDKVLHGADVQTAISEFITGYYHMWYLYMIVGLYIITPLIRKITEHKQVIEYSLIIGFVFIFFIPRINNLFTYINLPYITNLIDAIKIAFSYMNFHTTLGYLFYFILGYYLFKYDITIIFRRTGYTLGVIGYIITVFLTDWISNKMGIADSSFYSNFSINVMLMAIGIFLHAKYVLSKITLTEKGAQALCRLSKYTFGVYLVHAFVIDKFCEVLNFNTLSFNPIISIIVITSGVTIISLAVSIILNNIPLLKKYIV